MRTGVHCSVRRGFDAAAREAAALGCETLQIFTQSPSEWQTRVFTDQDFSSFQKERKKLDLHPVVVHTPFMPNLCTTREDMYQRSVRALKEDLECCEKLGAEYLVIHPGAFSPDSDLESGIQRIIAAFNRVLSEVPGQSMILIENMAGGGRRIGGTFLEISKIIDGVNQNKRIGVCFDTCHAFAAGYDMSSTAGVAATFKEFDETVGLDKIRVFHVNDSKREKGSRRDLHEHIGKGLIGKKGFQEIFKVPAFNNCALILETPKLPMPQSDLENLKTLRSLLP